eukprot:652856-Pleurochrysis_carterae.AAC.3
MPRKDMRSTSLLLVHIGESQIGAPECASLGKPSSTRKGIPATSARFPLFLSAAAAGRARMQQAALACSRLCSNARRWRLVRARLSAAAAAAASVATRTPVVAERALRVRSSVRARQNSNPRSTACACERMRVWAHTKVGACTPGRALSWARAVVGARCRERLRPHLDGPRFIKEPVVPVAVRYHVRKKVVPYVACAASSGRVVAAPEGGEGLEPVLKGGCL